MKKIATTFILFPLLATLGSSLEDPISDFLILPIKERYTDASVLVEVHRVTLDINGDGIDEQFIGHNMMWWGDNHGWYGAFYKSFNNGFIRLTPNDKAIGIDSRFFGPRETSFIGYVNEKQTQGVLVLANDFITPNPTDPGEPPIQPEQYLYRKFYHIQDNQLIVDDLGPLDLRTPEGKMFFKRYFGEGVKSRPLQFEDYPINKLKELGYVIPDWKHPPDSSSVQGAPQNTPSPTRVESTSAPKQVVTPAASPVTEAKQSSSSFPIIAVPMIAVAIVGTLVFLLRRKSS